MISERLKDIRDEYNLTQQDMANVLGVSRGHYSMWEIDKELIPIKKLNLVCNHFNVNRAALEAKVATQGFEWSEVQHKFW